MRPTQAPFPLTRLRRTRQSPAVRALVRENYLSAQDLIWPVFVRDGENIEEPIPSMPGVMRRSVDRVVEAAKEAYDLGIGCICLFPYTGADKRTADCAEAWNPENLSNRATRAIKAALPDMAVMTDVALDPYSDTGHDGFVVDGEIINDETVEALIKQALAQAEAGVDIIGPSDMMDGRIGAIRDALDEAGHTEVLLLSYTAKYASCYYGPFRDALESAPKFGDKKTYQMDPANAREAIREAEMDEAEGADIMMVKPAGPYLDIIRDLREETNLPIAAYQVSGEYAMIEAAAEKGWLDRDKVILESLTAIRRAGADIIFTYYAPYAAKLLKK